MAFSFASFFCISQEIKSVHSFINAICKRRHYDRNVSKVIRLPVLHMYIIFSLTKASDRVAALVLKACNTDDMKLPCLSWLCSSANLFFFPEFSYDVGDLTETFATGLTDRNFARGKKTPKLWSEGQFINKTLLLSRMSFSGLTLCVIQMCDHEWYGH